MFAQCGIAVIDALRGVESDSEDRQAFMLVFCETLTALRQSVTKK